jgi:hypothetical protein
MLLAQLVYTLSKRKLVPIIPDNFASTFSTPALVVEEEFIESIFVFVTIRNLPPVVC